MPDKLSRQIIAAAWANACLVRYDAANPHASPEERARFFAKALDGGDSLALEIAKDDS